jgi:nucleotide-binding universal stress UspA family protein
MYAEFNSILVAVDGHGGGQDAAALAEALASSEDVAIAQVDVPAEFHRLVEERGADLLAVGAHHHARAALRELPCAVAVAPAGYATRRPAIRTIGVGFVHDRAGRVVLDAARGLAWALDAEVHATTVVGPSNWESAASGMGWKAAAAARRMAEIPGVHGAAMEGRPDRALAALAGTVDLLVIGSRQHSLVRWLLLGDVARNLAHSSRCPLLVVPHS